MNIDALPSFDPTPEGYCHAVTAYALTGNPYIVPWIEIVNDMLASGELVWEPALSTEERHSRLQAIRNMALAIGLLSKQRLKASTENAGEAF
jgi:hypothetical protein